MILCDIGNTTYHFKTKDKEFKINVDDNLELLKNYDSQIYYISVNKKATKKLLNTYPTAKNIKSYMDFETNYVGMGIDRQVVCSEVDHGIIVDVGSAITVDIMKDSSHLGGFIMPGINAYRKTYPKISKKLTFKFEKNVNLDKIPQNTNDAINYAVLNSIILPIFKVQKEYNLPLIFTGGDSDRIVNYFDNDDYRYDKNLIFRSMQNIIHNKKGNQCLQ